MAEKNTDLISVIVPVFNSERYIERCINSLLQQTYDNIEIIFVDDGSSDRSKYIIKKYSANNKRIKYIYQSNQGVSKARNRGINASKGQYLLFVDSDDYIADTMIEYMHQQYINTNCDLVICGFWYVSNENKRQLFKGEEKLYFKQYDSKVIKALYDSKLMFAIGTKLYRKDIVQKGSIRFKNQDYLEDINFCMDYLRNCSSLYICRDAFYYYDITLADSLNKKNKRKDQNVIILKHMDELFELFESVSDITDDFYSIYVSGIMSGLKDIYMKNAYSPFKVWRSISQVSDHVKKYNLNLALCINSQESNILDMLLNGKIFNVMYLLISY